MLETHDCFPFPHILHHPLTAAPHLFLPGSGIHLQKKKGGWPRTSLTTLSALNDPLDARPAIFTHGRRLPRSRLHPFLELTESVTSHLCHSLGVPRTFFVSPCRPPHSRHHITAAARVRPATSPASDLNDPIRSLIPICFSASTAHCAFYDTTRHLSLSFQPSDLILSVSNSRFRSYDHHLRRFSPALS